MIEHTTTSRDTTDSKVHRMSRGCNLCDGHRSCGNHHLYVIELDIAKCLDDPVFIDEFGTEVREAYYVGRTTHTIECRYNQHSGKKRGKFSCHCFTDEPELRRKHKRVKYMQHHLPGGLRPDMTAGMNPAVIITPDMDGPARKHAKDAADAAELALAESLRKRPGVAVHSN